MAINVHIKCQVANIRFHSYVSHVGILFVATYCAACLDVAYA